MPKKILFVAEAVTLAHVARPLALAAALDPAEFEVALACDPRARWAASAFRGEVRSIRSIEPSAFLRALAVGRPVYDEQTLEAYVREDLAVLEAVRPDVVVGDFRLSLSVSARRAGIPYWNLTNAYWSAYYACPRYPIPSHPATRFLPIPLADAAFQLVRPLAFKRHARPLARVRRRHGLPPLGGDLRRAYTDGDRVLYADVPELFPLRDAPPEHRFLGPILWSPPVALPEWWSRLPRDRPLVYVTLGSSGHQAGLDATLEALSQVDCTIAVATAGLEARGAAPRNAYVARYLPGTEVAERSKLVICNGGSPTSQQALAAGVPVLGVASNLDQFLNMRAIATAGAGRLVRADRASAPRILAAVRDLLANPAYAESAAKVSAAFARYRAGERFRALARAATP